MSLPYTPGAVACLCLTAGTWPLPAQQVDSAAGHAAGDRKLAGPGACRGCLHYIWLLASAIKSALGCRFCLSVRRACCIYLALCLRTRRFRLQIGPARTELLLPLGSRRHLPFSAGRARCSDWCCAASMGEHFLSCQEPAAHGALKGLCRCCSCHSAALRSKQKTYFRFLLMLGD